MRRRLRARNIEIRSSPPSISQHNTAHRPLHPTRLSRLRKSLSLSFGLKWSRPDLNQIPLYTSDIPTPTSSDHLDDWLTNTCSAQAHFYLRRSDSKLTTPSCLSLYPRRSPRSSARWSNSTNQNNTRKVRSHAVRALPPSLTRNRPQIRGPDPEEAPQSWRHTGHEGSDPQFAR